MNPAYEVRDRQAHKNENHRLHSLLEYFEEPRIELYNLKRDVGETQNLASDYPEKARELQLQLRNWRQRINAALPQPNPDARR